MKYIIATNKWKNVKKILSDFRNLNLEFAIDEIDKIVLLKNKNIKKEYNNVFIVDKPDTTAFIYVYQKLLNKSDLKHCSTIEQAIKLLELEMLPLEIEYILKSLNTEFIPNKI